MAQELYPSIFTCFQICWALAWALTHIRMRAHKRYAENRIHPDRNRRYKVISYFLYLAQNLLCIASFWSDALILLKIHDLNQVRLVGVMLVSLATFLYFISVGYLGRNYSPCFDSYVPFELVSAGPYKVLRHPMYLAKLLIVVGNFLLSGSLWFVPMFIYLLLETVRTISREEGHLVKAIPGYIKYKGRTSRIIPFIV